MFVVSTDHVRRLLSASYRKTQNNHHHYTHEEDQVLDLFTPHHVIYMLIVISFQKYFKL